MKKNKGCFGGGTKTGLGINFVVKLKPGQSFSEQKAELEKAHAEYGMKLDSFVSGAELAKVIEDCVPLPDETGDAYYDRLDKELRKIGLSMQHLEAMREMELVNN